MEGIKQMKEIKQEKPELQVLITKLNTKKVSVQAVSDGFLENYHAETIKLITIALIAQIRKVEKNDNCPGKIMKLTTESMENLYISNTFEIEQYGI